MTMAPPSEGILLVDDGELDEVAGVLDQQGIRYTRLRGGQISDEIAPPRDLLIVTPRRVEHVRRGSPVDADPGRPLRIIAVEEDSPAMRRRLRRSGLHLLIRLPAAADLWRLLVARALYRGNERRVDPRIAVGSPVELGPEAPETWTVLVDISNRGCRLETSERLSIGDRVEFTIPADGHSWSDQGPLTLRGNVRRIAADSGSARQWVAVVFEGEMAERDRTRLTALINHWASGPHSLPGVATTGVPPLPSCQIPSLPDLTLDDETDPPIPAASDLRISLSAPDSASADTASAPERRANPRGQFESTLAAENNEGPFVLIGRDLSAGGMRIEHHPDLKVGDRFRVALHSPIPGETLLVSAEVIRDEGANGFGLAFDEIDDETGRELEKVVACLPSVESLEDGEIAGLGAVLSEIIHE